MGYSFIISDSTEKIYLTEEQILVYFDIPLMFVCHDEYQNKYLVLCTDSDNLKYIIGKISKDTIIKMLEAKISMSEVFQNAEKKWRVIPGETIESDTIQTVKCFLESELPQKGANYLISDSSINNYLNELKSSIFEAYTIKISHSYNYKQMICNIIVKEKPVFSYNHFYKFSLINSFIELLTNISLKILKIFLKSYDIKKKEKKFNYSQPISRMVPVWQ